MSPKRGTKLAIIGLLLGCLVGFGVLLLRSIVTHQLVGLLEEEVSKSCDCIFEVDDVSVSLLKFEAVATNARIVADGRTRLQFEKVYADFSLADISNHYILLDLQLVGGFSEGVLASSPTFKFIDNLSTPPSPEKLRDKNRYRLKLMQLTMKSSRFIEPLYLKDLYGEGAELHMLRSSTDDFVLRPTIEELRLKLFRSESDRSRALPSKELVIGKLTTQVTITDAFAKFHDLLLTLNDAWAKGEAVVDLDHADVLTGNYTYSIDSKSLDFPDWIRTQLEGAGEFSGQIGNPGSKGSIASVQNQSTILGVGGFDLLDLPQMTGKYTFDFQHGTPLTTVRDTIGSGPGAELRLSKPLTLNEDLLDSSFQVRAQTFSFGTLKLHDINGRLDVNGILGDLRMKVEGQAGEIEVGAFTLPSASIVLNEQTEGFEFDVQHAKDDLGMFRATGIYNPETPKTSLEKVAFEASDLSIREAGSPDGAEVFRLSGNGRVNGQFGTDTLEGESQITLSASQVASLPVLQGKAVLKRGILETDLSDSGGTLKATLTWPFSRKKDGNLHLDLKDFRPRELYPDLECVGGTLQLDYSLPVEAPAAGNGSLDLKELELGCGSHQISLRAARKFPISKGRFALDKTEMVGPESSLLLDGSVSFQDGLDLRLEGSLYLDALIGFTPRLDDLRGLLQASLNVRGPLTEPTLEGLAHISQGQLSLESEGLDVAGVEGKFELKGRAVTLQHLTGVINGGKFELGGEIYPLDLEHSQLAATFSEVLLQPFEDTSLVFSGNLRLSSGPSQRAMLDGLIELDSGEFRKDLDLTSLLRLLPAYLFATEGATPTSSPKYPDIDLNIALVATRNFFVLTEWLGSELRGDLKFTGTLANPVLTGDLETLSGWFGFKDRRFEITSGALNFKSGYTQPFLEVISETTVRSRTGENHLVLLEASGPLTSPSITLTSDRGLNEREILTLLTSSGSISGSQTLANTTGSEFDLAEPLFQDSSEFEFSTLLSRIARIDLISVEPAFNPRRGTIDPTLIARKKIFENVSAIGQSFLVEQGQDARALLQYDLSDRLRLTGSVDSQSAEENTSIGLDLAFTILSQHKPYVKITLNGHSNFDAALILRRTRLNENSRIPYNDLDRVARSVEDFYHTRGYRDTKVKANCLVQLGDCRELELEIAEGAPTKISDIILEAALPLDEPASQILRLEKLKSSTIGETASEGMLEKTERSITRRFRSEGYIGCRVRASYLEIPSENPEKEPAKTALSLVVQPGEPVTFIFTGNTQFTAEEFLATINILERKQPFGNNTINLLLENIERKYREAGFLYATTQYTKEADPGTRRVNYVIHITEESRVRVRKVVLEGNEHISREELRKELQSTQNPQIEKEIFAPEAGIAEQLESNAALIQNIYIEEGYPYARVNYALVPVEGEDLVDVMYRIHEGEVQKADWISVEGMPEDVILPPEPEAPYSIPKANRYIDLFISTLVDAGYYSPEIWSDVASGGTTLIIHVIPGTRAFISHIEILGLDSIPEQVVRSHLFIADGDPWVNERIRESRRALLKLGLFSRVDTEPQDGEIDSPQENLVVRLTERALHTLELGGGVNSEFGLHVFGEATDKSLFKDGRSLGLRFDTYYDDTTGEITRGVGSLQYSHPNILSSPYILTEDVRYQKFDISTLEFDLDRISLVSNLYRSWDNSFTHSIGHTILQENLDNVSPGAILSDLDTGVVNLSFISGAFNFDARDNPLNPRSGYNLSGEYTFASEALASDADYYSLSARGSGLLPFEIGERSFSLALASHVASAWTYGDTGDIPISQRYYLGGRSSIRGFRENSLGPRGEDGSVIGGDLLIANNLEFQYHPTGATSVHLFFDAGTVYLKDEDVDFDDLRTSTGVGFRYLSPIGPIGFDIGHPLDERDGEPSVRFHFVIGSNF